MAKNSLKDIAIRSSKLEFGGHIAAQAIRLISNLILSRLLFPEAFGLSALVSILIVGMAMLSDVGVEQSVIQNPRGDDIHFLNTAWVLHISRGLMIWLGACVISWPMAKVYGEPQLVYLLPVSALGVVVGGFASTSLFTLRRRLEVATLTWIELGSQLVSVVAIGVWAYWYPSVWALVAGGLIGTIFKTVASHRIDVGYRNRFEWDPSANASIMSFGKWILASTALSFVSSQSDRLVLGYYMGVATLGVYNIAMFLSEAVGSAVGKITTGVLYPVFSRIQRESPQRMREIYYRTRFRIDIISLIPIGALFILSGPIVHFLYDARYWEAGWMMQLLCIRVAMGIVLGPMETCLFSMGHTRYGLYRNIGKTFWTLSGIPIAYFLYGIKGVVWVIALSEIPVLIILWIPFSRIGLLRPSREIIAVLIFGIGLLLGLAIDSLSTYVTPYIHHRLR